MEGLPDQLLAYHLDGAAVGDAWPAIFVVFNGKNKSQKINLPPGNWLPVLDGKKISEKGLGKAAKGSVSIPAQTPMIFKIV